MLSFRAAKGTGAEQTASGDKQSLIGEQITTTSVPGTSLNGQQSVQAHSDMELLGQQVSFFWRRARENDEALTYPAGKQW